MADAAPIATPCTGVCTIDAAGLCLGCARTLDEIARWSVLSPCERQAIMAGLPARGGALANPSRGS